MLSRKRERESQVAVGLGFALNGILAVLKTMYGIIGHSPALLADGINATSDVAYYVVVLVFMRLASKPPDHEHPYGHRQLESIAALVVGSFVITTAVAIFWNAIDTTYDLLIEGIIGSPATSAALWVALFTVLLKWGIMVYTSRIGQRTENTAVIALAYDHRNDLFAAIAVVIGILFSRQGFLWVDPVAGGIVALFILATGIEILRESSQDLMDTVPGKTLANVIVKHVYDVPRVDQIEEVHVHRFGPYLVINLTIGVAGDISVYDGDAIATAVEHNLYAEIDYLYRVYVHYHPSQEENRHLRFTLPPEESVIS